jgi:hypothetical protein
MIQTVVDGPDQPLAVERPQELQGQHQHYYRGILDVYALIEIRLLEPIAPGNRAACSFCSARSSMSGDESRSTNSISASGVRCAPMARNELPVEHPRS